MLSLVFVSGAAAQDQPNDADAEEPAGEDSEYGLFADDTEEGGAETADAETDEEQSPESSEGTVEEPAPAESAPRAEGEITAEADASVSLNATADDTDAEEPPKPKKWRNSIFIFNQSLATSTLDPGAQQSYNPNYAWFFNLRPRWYLDDEQALFVAVGQGLSLELTDTDNRVRNREPVLLDTNVDLIWGRMLQVDLGVGKMNFSGGARAVLPLSIASRAQQMLFGIGPTVLARMPIQGIAKGFLVGFNTRWQHNFRTGNTTQTETDFPCFTLDQPEQRCTNTGGPSSDSDSVIFTLLTSLSLLPNFSVDTSFTWWWRFGQELAPATVGVDSAPGGTITVEDMSDTKLNLVTNFSIGATYIWSPWLITSLSFSTFTGEFNADGSRRNPFFNQYDSTIQLTAAFVLDQFYSAFFEEKKKGGSKLNPNNMVRNNRELSRGAGL